MKKKTYKNEALDYEIRDNLVIDRQSGAYRFSVETDGLRRYTAFMRYTFEGPEGEDPFHSIEEIDVDARNEGEAWDVADRARESDYEPDGVIFRVEERFGWYM